MALVNCH